MDISVISSGSTATPTSVASAKPTDNPAASAPAATTASVTPANDTVTLSPAAQEAVANTSTSNPADALSAKAAATTDKDLAQFYALAATAVDTSGQYSQDQQLDAYLKFYDASPKWQPTLADYASVCDAVFKDSAISKKSAAVADTYNAAAVAATQNKDTNTDQGIAQAKLDAAKAMSDFDRKVLFQTKTHRSDSGGRYADEGAWLSALQDQASGKDVSSLASNYKTLYGLAAVITDKTGKYSADDQLSAYVEYNKDWVFDQFKNLDDTASRLMDRVDNSSIAQRSMQIYNDLINPAVALFELGDPSSGRRVVKAELEGFNALSDFDKKVFFETSVNNVLQNRGHPYSSMQQWLDAEAAFANGGTGQTEPTDTMKTGSAGQASQTSSPTAKPSTESQTPAAPPTDTEKALAILKAYAAGQAEKTDSDKALAALKNASADSSGTDAGLQILKTAAEVSQKSAAARHSDADNASTVATTASERPSAKQPTPSSNKTGSTLSLTA